MHTRQMETDTTTEEREVLAQRADEALKSGNPHDLRVVRDQLREHGKMYGGDQAMPFVVEHLEKLDAALGESADEDDKLLEEAQ